MPAAFLISDVHLSSAQELFAKAADILQSKCSLSATQQQKMDSVESSQYIYDLKKFIIYYKLCNREKLWFL